MCLQLAHEAKGQTNKQTKKDPKQFRQKYRIFIALHSFRKKLALDARRELVNGEAEWITIETHSCALQFSVRQTFST